MYSVPLIIEKGQECPLLNEDCGGYLTCDGCSFSGASLKGECPFQKVNPPRGISCTEEENYLMHEPE